MSDNNPKATETAEVLEGIQERFDKHDVGGAPEAMEGYTKAVLSEGTMYPDVELFSETNLPVKARLTGKYQQPVHIWLGMGMMLGAALERDVPMDSEEEEQYRNGEFELP